MNGTMTVNWLGWVLSGIVLLLLFLTGMLLEGPVRLVLSGKRADGIVVGMNHRKTFGIRAVGQVSGTRLFAPSFRRNASSVSAEFPMITFTDRQGNAHTIRNSTPKPLSRLQKGDPVPVIYFADRPDMAMVDRWDELYLMPWVLTGMFVAFVAMFIWVLRGNIRLPG